MEWRARGGLGFASGTQGFSQFAQSHPALQVLSGAHSQFAPQLQPAAQLQLSSREAQEQFSPQAQVLLLLSFVMEASFRG